MNYQPVSLIYIG